MVGACVIEIVEFSKQSRPANWHGPIGVDQSPEHSKRSPCAQQSDCVRDWRRLVQVADAHGRRHAGDGIRQGAMLPDVLREFTHADPVVSLRLVEPLSQFLPLRW